MSESTLTAQVFEFARLTAGLTEESLDLDWAWEDYDEGLRMAFFRSYAQLRELAVRVAASRVSAGRPLSTAQRILGQYQAAYRDLQAVLAGVNHDLASRPPVQGEWPVVRTIRHMLETESNFLPVVMKGISRFRQGGQEPGALRDEEYDAFWQGSLEESLPSSLDELMETYDKVHERVLAEVGSIQETELEAPSVFWESRPMPVRFRLHRFDAHLRQHTIQVEKTLEALGASPGEAKRLLRLIYHALAECEAAQFGLPAEVESSRSLAAEIQERTASVRETLRR